MKSWTHHTLLICLFIIQLNLTASVQAQSVDSGEVKSVEAQTEAVSIPNASEQKPDSEASSTDKVVTPSMEERTVESHGVLKIPEPKFITEGTKVRSQGVYLGVGFQQVRLDFREGFSILNNDSVLNGIAVNLGYFTEKFKLEYTRHVIILDLEETLTQQDVSFNAVEGIQNNFWYFRVLRLNPDLYFNYGIGVQTAEVRLILKESFGSVDSTSNLPDSSVLHQEGSLVFGGGLSYFFTANFFIQYRFTYGSFSPLITGPTANNALQSTQIHTLFLQYYFSL